MMKQEQMVMIVSSGDRGNAIAAMKRDNWKFWSEQNNKLEGTIELTFQRPRKWVFYSYHGAESTLRISSYPKDDLLSVYLSEGNESIRFIANRKTVKEMVEALYDALSDQPEGEV